MPKFANVHLVLNSRDRVLPGSSGVYNNFVLSNVGQNIVQGAMKDIALSEVLFPYDIPNVQEGYNTFTLISDAGENPNGVAYTLKVVMPPGFYTGVQLANEINIILLALGNVAMPALAPNETPDIDYDPDQNIFTFLPPTAAGWEDAWRIVSPFTYPLGYPDEKTIGKDLLSIMGYNRNEATQERFPGAGLLSGAAPLVFTQYIDICSPRLCQYQFLRDGSTTDFPRRVDLICRLYIADETSTALAYDASGFQFVPGSRPFVIHRQFKNQRVMRSTAANAINDVDIQLYDDCGQPLLTTWRPRDFQITFHVYEAGDRESEQNIGYRY